MNDPTSSDGNAGDSGIDPCADTQLDFLILVTKQGMEPDPAGTTRIFGLGGSKWAIQAGAPAWGEDYPDLEEDMMD